MSVQLIGDPGTPPPRLARALLATVDAVLSALPPHQVTLTVLAPGDDGEDDRRRDVELYLTFDAPLRSIPDLTRFGQGPARGGALARRPERGRARRRIPRGQLAEGRCPLTPVIDVAVVDDHPIILESAASWIRADESDIRLVATAATVAALLAGPGRQADVVLLDLDLGDGTTVDGNVAAILAAGPRSWSSRRPTGRPPSGRRCAAGARGYVLKNEQSERYARRSGRSPQAGTGSPPASPISSPPMTRPTCRLSVTRRGELCNCTPPACR